MSDDSDVVLEYRWSNIEGAFFINSEAGLIRYRPKSVKEAMEFRNTYLNEMESLSQLPKEQRRQRLFTAYRALRGRRGVRFRGNIRTRLRHKLGNLKNSF